MALIDTPWCSDGAAKMFLQSGRFTSTVKTSQDVTGIAASPNGVSWDGTNTPWQSSFVDKMYLMSGQFSSTTKDSQSVSGIDDGIVDISSDEINTPWSGATADKLYLQSGRFTSTLKTSEDVSGVDTSPQGISYDASNTPWCGNQADKLYLQSGQFTSTLKTSVSVTSVEAFPTGISFDGTDTEYCGRTDDKLYLQSGQFTTTLKTSEYVGGIGLQVSGIEVNDVNARLSISSAIIEITIPIMEVASIGHYSDDVRVTIPIIGVAGMADGVICMNASLTFPVLEVSSFSFVAISPDVAGIGAITMPALAVDAARAGSGIVLLSMLTVSSTGVQGEIGTFANALFTLPFGFQVRAYNGSAPECVVMNTKNFAVTEYVNYGFNSMARFNGANLIADQNGIYEQDGTDTDGPDAYKIKAHIKSGRIDIHKNVVQKLRNAWLNYQTDGDVQIVTRADKKETRYYMLPYHSALNGINERRSKFERGIRNRYFDFKIQNIEGSQLEIDKLTITLEPVVSKRR